ncbi:hypothetical protein CANARDRAFT_29336 [[Candida] arabinofermentans NRRL YB-2248]|uniref:Proteasome subunit beta n=1 Tax=[Candida] arabinofermentans NRRL YB-2248 TaxID=983967 RepID=A0A1E4SXH0_9ASCO|nr:hypothetical protein CANARDRAFT_29336 [[Candida] arabinofermentans NRRL YB-2248]
MNHDPYHWGRPSNETYGQYNYKISNASNINKQFNNASSCDFPTMLTQQPMITGTSVIAIKYNDGLIIAADNMGSYGSLMKIDDLERLIQVGDKTIVGISGDISDLQQIERMLDDVELEESYDMESSNLNAEHIHEYLSNVLYNRRSKMNPLWNACIVGGFDSNDEIFLKYVDMLGVSYSSPSMATGFGAHLAIPLLREKVDKESDVVKLNKQDAIQLVKDCMKILFYRDARSLDKYSLCIINKTSKEIEFLKNLKCEDMNWEVGKNIRGYGIPQL